MTQETGWISLPDAVFAAGGRVSRWQLYTAALEHRVEARRRGRVWEIRRDSLTRFLAELRKREKALA